MCVADPTALKDSVIQSLMFKDSAITDICENLNRKSRESKFAQRVRQEISNIRSVLCLLSIHFFFSHF